MARTKRNKQIALTKTKKKDQREVKVNLVETLSKCIEKYENLFVFEYQNMTTNPFR